MKSLISAAAVLLSALGHAAEPAPANFTNAVGMTFVRIPAGNFAMGAGDSERGARADERPRHRVTLTRPFYIGRTEVTLAQWQAVMRNSPYDDVRSNPFYELPGMAARINRPDHPATVSWNDAQAFIRKLNEREGHTRYRFPTEAEWEYAARGGTTSAYSFGEDAAALGKYAWFGESFATGSTHPVAKKLPNPWGLYDVHGNAWEWVNDWYATDYYGRSPAADPNGPTSGTAKVVRGGSWHETANDWRSSFRKPYAPDYRGISIGFRVVLDDEQRN